VTDSRIQAERWIAANVNREASILTEGGGFPSDSLFPLQPGRRKLNASEFIRTADCVSRAAQIRDVLRLVDGVDWFGIIEENRLRHFLAVPEEYPVGHGFYARLKGDTLGFKLAARFKVLPGIGPFVWARSFDEPTMTAFDHLSRGPGGCRGPVHQLV
jgi:hypothetical protein